MSGESTTVILHVRDKVVSISGDREYLTNVSTSGTDGSAGDGRMVGVELLLRF